MASVLGVDDAANRGSLRTVGDACRADRRAHERADGRAYALLRALEKASGAARARGAGGSRADGDQQRGTAAAVAGPRRRASRHRRPQEKRRVEARRRVAAQARGRRRGRDGIAAFAAARDVAGPPPRARARAPSAAPATPPRPAAATRGPGAPTPRPSCWRTPGATARGGDATRWRYDAAARCPTTGTRATTRRTTTGSPRRARARSAGSRRASGGRSARSGDARRFACKRTRRAAREPAGVCGRGSCATVIDAADDAGRAAAARRTARAVAGADHHSTRLHQQRQLEQHARAKRFLDAPLLRFWEVRLVDRQREVEERGSPSASPVGAATRDGALSVPNVGDDDDDDDGAQVRGRSNGDRRFGLRRLDRCACAVRRARSQRVRAAIIPRAPSTSAVAARRRRAAPSSPVCRSLSSSRRSAPMEARARPPLLLRDVQAVQRSRRVVLVRRCAGQRRAGALRRTTPQLAAAPARSRPSRSPRGSPRPLAPPSACVFLVTVTAAAVPAAFAELATTCRARRRLARPRQRRRRRCGG